MRYYYGAHGLECMLLTSLAVKGLLFTSGLSWLNHLQPKYPFALKTVVLFIGINKVLYISQFHSAGFPTQYITLLNSGDNP